MNKKGFTLVELLAVVVIMGILALIAVPAVTRILERGKRQQYITDAKEMISKAKYQFKMDDIELTSCESLSGCSSYQMYTIENLKLADNFDAYDDEYLSASYVIVYNIQGDYKYYVRLQTNNHFLLYNNVVLVSEEDLEEAYIEAKN